MEKLVKEIEYMTQELSANSLANQRCDFTGWNLTEAMVAIALELKRWNDREEGQK